MFDRILVVCVGNICRSPVGERLLARELASSTRPVQIGSAGIAALEGQGADELASEVAQAHGLSLEGHVARQFTPELARDQDLILVMEPGHRAEILKQNPQLAGRIMLFDRWTGDRGIVDPYRRSREMHEVVFSRISEAAKAWATRLA